ncbi:hypothetical protein BDQ12DRAFT_689576 [Crucibulum laeve]|uniref:Uncharacterized protein n=1 Tax=Crucibulum laeve TaxID=68775 RepID=A0A5C3LNZ5_9AGAR|nr:hypothetical protein BDQ12DRAFT_694305 [Crucibulum laeve]TFK34610.1 hypothetical protein BDQ12DRAFT_689576 [Crucibulum laeve]
MPLYLVSNRQNTATTERPSTSMTADDETTFTFHWSFRTAKQATSFDTFDGKRTTTNCDEGCCGREFTRNKTGDPRSVKEQHPPFYVILTSA